MNHNPNLLPLKTIPSPINATKAYTRIGIVGLGYVGLPLSLQFARSGVRVVGIDIDEKKTNAINNGQSYIHHISAAAVRAEVAPGRFTATTDFSAVKELEAVIICVPTPLNKNREPDISYIMDTGQALAPHVQPGQLIVLESTTYPGTTDADLRVVLEQGSGLKAGADFHLAFSPEREDPGNPQSVVAQIPKVVGGFTPQCLELACALYGKAIQKVVPVSSCRAAEATKLLENIFRSVNIALVNELKLVYGAMGIDVWEVINAAKTKPFGYMPFYPGPGLGGHCIPIDPFYLTWKAREYGQSTRFIELAGEVNTAMPEWVVNRTAEALNSRCQAINGSRILVVGLAYKANVDDMRESPTFILLEKLQQRGARVAYYDPFIPIITHTREHAQWTGSKSIEWSQPQLAQFDCVLISTAHQCINYQQLLDWAPLVVDTRNATHGLAHQPNQVWKA